MLKRLLKRLLIALLIVLAAYVIVTNIAFFKGLGGSVSEAVIIDTDSGNDIDDLYALARALIEPDLQITGLLSSQWNFAENAPDSTVLVSQETNEHILKLLKRTDIPHRVGSAREIRVKDIPLPQPSEAAKYIITRAHELPSGEKLKVVTLGPTTNLASAILLDSTIIPKLDCYIMGLKYDLYKKVWNKNEFNTRNDLDAMDIILNTINLDVTVMTVSVAEGLRFNKSETFDKLAGKGDIWSYLVERWDKKYPGNDEWIMQDVMLIEAIIHPRFAKTIAASTPPENTRRKINVYSKIKTKAMIEDYWKAVEKATGN